MGDCSSKCHSTFVLQQPGSVSGLHKIVLHDATIVDITGHRLRCPSILFCRPLAINFCVMVKSYRLHSTLLCYISHVLFVPVYNSSWHFYDEFYQITKLLYSAASMEIECEKVFVFIEIDGAVPKVAAFHIVFFVVIWFDRHLCVMLDESPVALPSR